MPTVASRLSHSELLKLFILSVVILDNVSTYTYILSTIPIKVGILQLLGRVEDELSVFTKGSLISYKK